jgi:hypothetical protein
MERRSERERGAVPDECCRDDQRERERGERVVERERKKRCAERRGFYFIIKQLNRK